MPRDSSELQYMVREPITPSVSDYQYLHKFVKEDECLHVKFGGRQGFIYFDGVHICFRVTFGDVIEFSVQAPRLQIFLKNETSHL